MKIHVNPYSLKSWNEAIRTVKRYKDSLPGKLDKLLKQLTEYGATTAQTMYDMAPYDIEYMTGDYKTPAISVSVSGTDAQKGTVRYTISANGHDVAFVEFGAGVTLNGAGNGAYPKQRPPGIQMIGEYGNGFGKRKVWAYTDESDETHLTIGTPATPGMYYAAQYMRDNIEQMAKEIFKS